MSFQQVAGWDERELTTKEFTRVTETQSPFAKRTDEEDCVWSVIEYDEDDEMDVGDNTMGKLKTERKKLAVPKLRVCRFQVMPMRVAVPGVNFDWSTTVYPPGYRVTTTS